MAEPSKTFTELIVWQKAHALVLRIYTFTKTFPVHEQYGLVSQYRRAAVSIPANIAEGFKRRTKPDKARFLNIAQASLEEARYYAILARDLSYGEDSEAESLLQETSKLLEAYVRHLTY